MWRDHPVDWDYIFSYHVYFLLLSLEFCRFRKPCIKMTKISLSRIGVFSLEHYMDECTLDHTFPLHMFWTSVHSCVCFVFKVHRWRHVFRSICSSWPSTHLELVYLILDVCFDSLTGFAPFIPFSLFCWAIAMILLVI